MKSKKKRELTENEIKIRDYIYDKLDYMYCDNCRFGSEIKEEECTDESGIYWGCEDCYRKYNGWGISKLVSENIAKDIIEMINQ